MNSNSNNKGKTEEAKNELGVISKYAEGYKDIRIHWRYLTILETSNKNVWSNVFRYLIYIYIFWKFIKKICIWDKTITLKKFPSEKNKRYKKCTLIYFPSYNSSPFLSRDSYTSRSTRLRFKVQNCIWDFPFSIPLRFC